MSKSGHARKRLPAAPPGVPKQTQTKAICRRMLPIKAARAKRSLQLTKHTFEYGLNNARNKGLDASTDSALITQRSNAKRAKTKGQPSLWCTVGDEDHPIDLTASSPPPSAAAASSIISCFASMRGDHRKLRFFKPISSLHGQTRVQFQRSESSEPVSAAVSTLLIPYLMLNTVQDILLRENHRRAQRLTRDETARRNRKPTTRKKRTNSTHS